MPLRSRSTNPSVARKAIGPSRTPPAQAELLQKRCELGQALDRFDACLPTPRRTHSRLGVQLNRVSDGKLQIATSADENDIVRPGLVAEWNKLQDKHLQSKRIQQGDRIAAVNHSPDYFRMMEELDQAPRITLTIERDRPGVWMPMANLSATSQSWRPKSIDGLSSRGPMLPPLPPMKCEKQHGFGSGTSSISEGSTREPSPRKVSSFGSGTSSISEGSTGEHSPRKVSSPNGHPGPYYVEAMQGIEAAYTQMSSGLSSSPIDRMSFGLSSSPIDRSF